MTAPEGGNVVSLASAAAAAPAAPFATPKHFKKRVLKAAWADLIERAAPALLTRENYFTFEMAATLLAKFRAGEAMTATESKELKRLMVSLGLQKGDDAGDGKPPSRGSRYFDSPPR